MSERVMIRQGDVLVCQLETFPRMARRRRGAMVLARGEATGHAHVLEAPTVDGALAELLELDARLFARVRGGDARVIHQEHGPVVLPPGDYEIVRQREYVPPPAGMPTRWSTRRVAD